MVIFWIVFVITLLGLLFMIKGPINYLHILAIILLVISGVLIIAFSFTDMKDNGTSIAVLVVFFSYGILTLINHANSIGEKDHVNID